MYRNNSTPNIKDAVALGVQMSRHSSRQSIKDHNSDDQLPNCCLNFIFCRSGTDEVDEKSEQFKLIRESLKKEADVVMSHALGDTIQAAATLLSGNRGKAGLVALSAVANAVDSATVQKERVPLLRAAETYDFGNATEAPMSSTVATTSFTQISKAQEAGEDKVTATTVHKLEQTPSTPKSITSMYPKLVQEGVSDNIKGQLYPKLDAQTKPAHIDQNGLASTTNTSKLTDAIVVQPSPTVSIPNDKNKTNSDYVGKFCHGMQSKLQRTSAAQTKQYLDKQAREQEQNKLKIDKYLARLDSYNKSQLHVHTSIKLKHNITSNLLLLQDGALSDVQQLVNLSMVGQDPCLNLFRLENDGKNSILEMIELCKMKMDGNSTLNSHNIEVCGVNIENGYILSSVNYSEPKIISAKSKLLNFFEYNRLLGHMVSSVDWLMKAFNSLNITTEFQMILATVTENPDCDDAHIVSSKQDKTSSQQDEINAFIKESYEVIYRESKKPIRGLYLVFKLNE